MSPKEHTTESYGNHPNTLGGFGTDRWGYKRTLMTGMLFHAAWLVVISCAAHSPGLMFPLLMLWSFSAWSSGPTQQYHLISLAPEATSIMLSLNSSVVQLAMAAGAGIGGGVVEASSLTAVTWIGAAGVAIAALMSAVAFGYFGIGAASRAAHKEARAGKISS